MQHLYKFIIASSLTLLAAGAAAMVDAQAPAEQSRPLSWPPAVDAQNSVVQTLEGRQIERYVHGPKGDWGYPATASWGFPPSGETGAKQQNISSFYLVHPIQARPDAPLCVVLHSANRTAYDYLGYGSLGRKLDADDDPATVVTRSPDDFYALYLNTTNEEWWGWSQVRQSPDYAKGIVTAPPAERRVLDTIEWIVQRFKIDRNRIYLCGVSMGGCGSLGIGLPNGNIFASVLVGVPAGTHYANYRLGGFAPSPAATAGSAERDAWVKRASAFGYPDPPVLVDFSSQADMWATTQPSLVQAAVAGRLPLVLCWGMFGHKGFGSMIGKEPICDVALAFPWQEIRKNEAYPVFTHASADQKCPWLNAPAEYDSAGQMNAWLRWKNVRDTAEDFAMELWIASPELKIQPRVVPEKVTADITFRRLQRFKIRPNQAYGWKLVRQGAVAASGKAVSDGLGLLTLPQMELNSAPGVLSVGAAAAIPVQ